MDMASRLELKRQEENLLGFVASRDALVQTISLPTIANTSFDVRHGLNTTKGERVRFQVIQAAIPVMVYQDPRDVTGTDFIRLRATANGGVVRILFTIDEGDDYALPPPVDSSFIVPSGIGTFGRPAADGEWQDVAFDAANFTGEGTMTWTVSSGQVYANRYTIVGKTMFWDLMIQASTIGGTPTTGLRAVIPGGYEASSASHTTALGYTNDAGTIVSGYAQVIDPTHVRFVKTSSANWTAGTNYIYGTLIISLV